jgi:hypothetical protein
VDNESLFTRVSRRAPISRNRFAHIRSVFAKLARSRSDATFGFDSLQPKFNSRPLLTVTP